MVCLAFFSAQRNQWEYLLLGVYCLSVGTSVLTLRVALDESIMRRSTMAVLLVALNQSSRTLALLLLAWISKAYRRLLMVVVVISATIPLIGAGSTRFQTSGWVTAGWLINYFVPLAVLLAITGLWRSRDFGGLVIVLGLLISNLTRSRIVSGVMGSVSLGGIVVFRGMVFWSLVFRVFRGIADHSWTLVNSFCNRLTCIRIR
jgi:hypothetical protein